MNEVRDRSEAKQENGYFVVDAAYLKDQAQDAVTTFFAPLTGLYIAVTGKPKGKLAHDSMVERRRKRRLRLLKARSKLAKKRA